VSAASIGAIQRALLEIDQQGGARFFGEPMLDIGDLLQTIVRDARRERAGGRRAGALTEALFDLPALAAVGALRTVARSRRQGKTASYSFSTRRICVHRRRARLVEKSSRSSASSVEGRRGLFRHQSPSDVPRWCWVSSQPVQHALRASHRATRRPEGGRRHAPAEPGARRRPGDRRARGRRSLSLAARREGQPDRGRACLDSAPSSQIGPISDGGTAGIRAATS